MLCRASLKILRKLDKTLQVSQCTLTDVRHQDEILGPSVRPYAYAMGPGLFLVPDNDRPHVARVYSQFLKKGRNRYHWQVFTLARPKSNRTPLGH